MKLYRIKVPKLANGQYSQEFIASFHCEKKQIAIATEAQYNVSKPFIPNENVLSVGTLVKEHSKHVTTASVYLLVKEDRPS